MSIPNENQHINAPMHVKVKPRENGRDKIISRTAHMDTARLLLKRHMTTDDRPHMFMSGDSLYAWSGGRYEPATSGFLNRNVRRLLDTYQTMRRDDRGEHVSEPYNPDNHLVSNVVNSLEALCDNVDDPRSMTWLGEQPSNMPPADEVFPAANGLVHVRTGELFQHTPHFFNMWVSPVKYDPRAQCPNWLEFVDSVYESRTDSMDMWQEVLGNFLISSTAVQALIFRHGPPGCGKGVEWRTAKRILGAGLVTRQARHFDNKDSFALSPLENKSVVCVPDARFGPGMSNAAMIETMLNLSGGDGAPMRRMREVTETSSYAKPWIISNDVIRMPDSAGGIKRRLRTLASSREFDGTPEKIANLEHRFDGELSGILNWAIRGGQRLLANGEFTYPEHGRDIHELVIHRSSDILEFVRGFCDVGSEYECTDRDMLAAYIIYMRSEGLDTSKINMKRIRETIKAALPRVTMIPKTRVTDSKGKTIQTGVLRGIRVKPDIELGNAAKGD